jgi:hypothetical protein
MKYLLESLDSQSMFPEKTIGVGCETNRRNFLCSFCLGQSVLKMSFHLVSGAATAPACPKLSTQRVKIQATLRVVEAQKTLI